MNSYDNGDLEVYNAYSAVSNMPATISPGGSQISVTLGPVIQDAKPTISVDANGVITCITSTVTDADGVVLPANYTGDIQDPVSFSLSSQTGRTTLSVVGQEPSGPASTVYLKNANDKVIINSSGSDNITLSYRVGPFSETGINVSALNAANAYYRIYPPGFPTVGTGNPPGSPVSLGNYSCTSAGCTANGSSSFTFN